MKGKNGFTLFEIIISTLIMSLVVLGLANIFISGKRYILHARARMVGGELGRHFIDPLQMHVREDTWDDPAINLLTPSNYLQQQQINNITYTANYTVSQNPATLGELRKVVVNLTWDEPQP